MDKKASTTKRLKLSRQTELRNSAELSEVVAIFAGIKQDLPGSCNQILIV
jgi:hypothetical protein